MASGGGRDGRGSCDERISEILKLKLKLKRHAAEELEVQSKKAKMIPTPGMLFNASDVRYPPAKAELTPLAKDTSSPDGEGDSTESDNDSDEAHSEESDVMEMLTPRTPSARSTPKPKYASEARKFPCTYPDCPKSFNRPAKLADHLRSHSNERPFKCTHEGCGKSFTRRTSLKDHIQCLHTHVRDHVCHWEGCDKRFRTSTKLKNHIAIHEGHERFRCTGYPPCNQVFRKHQTLQRHVTSIHLGQVPYPCTKIDPVTNKPCTQGFKQANHLRTHMARYHSGIRFWCHECKAPPSGDEDEAAEPRELGFHTYELFEQHKRLVHPPNCTLCPKVCSTQSELRRHIEAQHSDIRPENPSAYRCQVAGCGRGFTKKSNLKVHVRSVHEHIRSFVCGLTDLTKSKVAEGWNGQGACGRDFVAKRTLEEHVRVQHMGLKASRKLKTREDETSKGIEGETVKGSSMISRLTGVGYEDSRHIPCLYPSCPSRFTRQYDLEVHMKTRHGLSDGETVELFVEKEALNGGRFWFGADVQDEEYWDWTPENTTVFDHGVMVEGCGEIPGEIDRIKPHESGIAQKRGEDLMKLAREDVVAGFQGEDLVMGDCLMEDQGAEGEMLIDPALRTL